MRRRAPIAVLTALLAASGLAAARSGRGPRAHVRSATAAATAPALMRDEFDGPRLDRAHWSTCYWWASSGCTIASNHELEWYVPGQVSVSGGALRLTAARRDVRGADGRIHHFASGMISSGPPSEHAPPRFAFRYGRAEIRARVPAGRGLWSAFWLLPVNRRSRPEIDVAEILGQDPSTVHMHLHDDGPGGRPRDRGTKWRDPALAAGWHRFAIDWRPGRLTWLVDGVERFRITGAGVPSEPMYLLADLAVGGDWPGKPDRSTPFPSALEIDYVRVTR